MVNELLAYLTHPDGTKIQVLTPDGKVFDQETTKIVYDAYAATSSFSGEIEVFANTRDSEIVV